MQGGGLNAEIGEKKKSIRKRRMGQEIGEQSPLLSEMIE